MQQQGPHEVPIPNCRYSVVSAAASAWYLRAAPQEQGLQASAAAHQGLDAILRDLITPREVQVLQVPAALTERTRNTTTHVQSSL